MHSGDWKVRTEGALLTGPSLTPQEGVTRRCLGTLGPLSPGGRASHRSKPSPLSRPSHTPRLTTESKLQL